jgi:hypothetical protein
MILGVTITVIGLVAVIFHKTLAQLSVNYQNETVGRILKQKLGHSTAKFGELLFIALGITFTLVGLLATFDIIKLN